jgi:hypothetical protein
VKPDRFNIKLGGEVEVPPEVKEALIVMAKDFYRAGGVMTPEYWFDLSDDSREAFLEARRRLADECLAVSEAAEVPAPAAKVDGHE